MRPVASLRARPRRQRRLTYYVVLHIRFIHTILSSKGPMSSRAGSGRESGGETSQQYEWAAATALDCFGGESERGDATIESSPCAGCWCIRRTTMEKEKRGSNGHINTASNTLTIGNRTTRSSRKHTGERLQLRVSDTLFLQYQYEVACVWLDLEDYLPAE